MAPGVEGFTHAAQPSLGLQGPAQLRPHMEPSTRDTPFPGARQIDRAAFRRVAAELGSLDADIIGHGPCRDSTLTLVGA